jgi:DNA-directed RNA polymerase III subunit RPC6
MASGVEASKAVSGGSWYNTQGGLDVERIGALRRKCLDVVRHLVSGNHRSLTTTQIQTAMQGSSAFNCSLTELETIINTLVLDRVILKKPDSTYIVRRNPHGTSDLLNSASEVPCLTCEVVSQCKVGGYVNPETCPYMTDWLGGALDF